MPFALTPNVYVERAPDGTIRQLRHLQQPYTAAAVGTRPLAAQYLHDVAPIYNIPASALTALNNQFVQSDNFTADLVQLHVHAENQFMGASTVAYVQTLGGLPIWEAGVSVTVQPEPRRVTSSYSTYHYDAKVEKPEREFRPIPAATLEELFGLRKRERKTEITSQRRLIYRYEEALRQDPEAVGQPAALQGPKPSLPLPALPAEIAEGEHYIVTEVLFTTNPGPGSLNWRIFIEERTGAVLYLRAMMACVLGNVFVVDPVTDTGNGTITGCSGDATLDPTQTTVTLNVTPASGGSAQALTGPWVALTDFRLPTSALPRRLDAR